MNRISQLPIARHILVTFGLICVFLVANGGLIFFGLQTIERRNDELQFQMSHEWKISNDIAKNLGSMQAEIFLHVLVTSAEGMRFHDQVIRQIQATNAEKLAEYEKLVGSGPERRLYARAMQARRVYLERTDSLLVLSSKNEDIEKVRFAVSVQAPAYDEYYQAINAMADLSEQEARALATASTHLISQTKIIATVLLGLAIVIIIGTGFTVIGLARELREDNRILRAEIVERKQAEKARRVSDARYQTLF